MLGMLYCVYYNWQRFMRLPSLSRQAIYFSSLSQKQSTLCKSKNIFFIIDNREREDGTKLILEPNLKTPLIFKIEYLCYSLCHY